MSSLKRLVVVPSDPTSAYEKKGRGDLLTDYYNPKGLFEEVVVLSPREQGERKAHGMKIVGTTENRFRKLLREIHPDVVRAYGGYWPSDLVCRNRVPNVPIIVSVHDTLRDNIHRSVRYADLVVCTSEAVRRAVIAAGVDPSRTRLLPNRVDRGVFRKIEDPQLLSEVGSRFPPGKYILHVGRRAREKNPDTVIRALTYLPPEYSCVFLGPGDPTPYQDLAKEHRVENRCYWSDPIKNSDLPVWYSWCDCMCTPSRWEGFGIVFIEAAACGAAIVTSDIAPMNEYLRRDVDACLISDFEDPQALASGIRKTCEDTEYRHRIRIGAMEAAQAFDKQRVDDQEVEIYREAISIPPLARTRRFEATTWSVFFPIGAFLNHPVNATCNVSRRFIKEKFPFAVDALRNVYLGLAGVGAAAKQMRGRLYTRVRLMRGIRIDRNQWSSENKEATYRSLMDWSWSETESRLPPYFRRLSYSVSKAQGRVLEIGCGIGAMTRWLSESPAVEHIFAVDAFPKAIELLASYRLAKVTPMTMPLERLRFPADQRFDTIVLCEILEHVYWEEEKRMLEVLRKHIVNSRTRYVISVPIGWLSDPHHVRGFSKKGFIRHLRRFYGKPEEIDYSSGYSQVAWGYCCPASDRTWRSLIMDAGRHLFRRE